MPVCPAELDRPLPTRPVPADGAVIRHNAEGGEFLDGTIAWAEALAGVLTGAQQACREAGA